MTTTYVADHAWTFIDSASLKAAGYSGDIGYCSYDTTGKNWTPAQVKDRIGSGFKVGVNWETQGMRSLTGAAGAASDGPEFIKQAKALGATGGCLLVNLEDPSPVDPSNYPLMTDYARTMRLLIRQAGFAGMTGYGSDRYMTYCTANGGADRKWVVETWPRGTWNPDLEQLANSHPLNTWNGGIDCNIAIPDWGWTEFFGAHTTGADMPLDPNNVWDKQLLDTTHQVWEKVLNVKSKDPNGNDIGADFVWDYTWLYVKAINDLLNGVSAKIDKILAAEGATLTQGSQVSQASGALSDIDKDDIAARVVALLEKKLA